MMWIYPTLGVYWKKSGANASAMKSGKASNVSW